MTGEPIDMDKVAAVLRGAVKPDGPDSRRGLARKAGLDRDAVYDLIQGRNRNPSLKVLAALAEAMGKDLSVFGVGSRIAAPSAVELEAALIEVLPNMPRRGSWERKASFLAEAVAALLRLPPVARSSRRAAGRPRAPRAPGDAKPPAPTRPAARARQRSA